ncbi:MAG: ubiquinol-cytochrome c reductase iron-sulfur subunit [Gaiellales bacterium]
MSETFASPEPGRRAVLKLALGAGLCLPVAALAAAQDESGRKARPQANDRFVFGGGDRKGQVITLADLPAGGPLLTAYPMDPRSKVVRDDSRLNQVLLVRLDPRGLNGDTRARAADGVVAYSAVCTHTGCDVWEWQQSSSTIKCLCHFSEFDLKDSARVLNGPAPRRLPALPLKVVDGMPAVAGGFVGRPGFESGGG